MRRHFLFFVLLSLCCARAPICQVIQCSNKLQQIVRDNALDWNVLGALNRESLLQMGATEHESASFLASLQLWKSGAAPQRSSGSACDAHTCAHGHCERGRCLCSSDQWRAGHGTRYWENLSYVGERCHVQLKCPADCAGECVHHQCVCPFGRHGNACRQECVALEADDLCDALHVPQSALDSGRVQRVRELLRALPVSADARKAMCAQALHHRECTLSRKPARIAFLIMVHDARANSTTAAALQESSSGLAVLDLLLSLLWSPDNVYAVHVEPTAAPAYRAVLADVVARHGRGGHNVQLVAGARPVVWSGTSVVDGMLRGMRQLLRMSQRWELFVNLSGADFALHSADVLARRLAPLKRHNALWGNYVAATDQKTQTLLQKHVRETIVECRARIETLYRYVRQDPMPFHSLANGHLWMVLERQFVDHLVRSAHAARLHRYFRFARVPDEKFFLTALLHSNRFKYTWLRKQTRFVKWIAEANHPISLRNDETTFDSLMASDKLFARKFTFSKSKHLLARLAATIMEETEER